LINDERRLTLFLSAKNLYVMDWDGDRCGLFKIEKNFLPDPTCKYRDTRANCHELCKNYKVDQVRIGLDVLIESFEVLDKCRGWLIPVWYSLLLYLLLAVQNL
jgi:hypothetical protein